MISLISLIYSPDELESSFVEIINAKSKNDVVGVIYCHPSMDTSHFIEDKVEQLISKLNSKDKSKNIFIASDFNLDLLKLSSHMDTSNFYEKLTSNLIALQITIPTKINTKNDTLIDNIFFNFLQPGLVSDNTLNVSDGHLPSFAIFPKSKSFNIPKIHNLFTRDIKNVNKENFIFDIAAINWNEVIVESDANSTFNNFQSKRLELNKFHFKVVFSPFSALYNAIL